MAKKEWIQTGSIRLGKTGKLYLKIDTIKGLTDGCTLFINTPEENLERLHQNGAIDAEKLEKRIENVPDWLKYELTLVLD